MNQNLTDLIKKKQTAIKAGVGIAIDWDERRNNYLLAVDKLYEQVRSILAAPIEQGDVQTEMRAKDLTENYIGTYTVNDLILVIGNEQVRFSPRGRNIVGAAGRVDVIGEGAEAVLIVEPDERWSFVQTRQPSLKTVPFDEVALAEVLDRVMRD